VHAGVGGDAQVLRCNPASCGKRAKSFRQIISLPHEMKRLTYDDEKVMVFLHGWLCSAMRIIVTQKLVNYNVMH
jgi:hypothetical protein